ncbi:hypothetical protein D5086_017289 [Populus alba]|uniref:Uncharacterized protein n=1 Tax=Populus alba TaxID=43335 RepID=A0ACC4BX19_POPAL
MACMNRWSKLELELVADVGIVGAPNAWKSTLSSVTSAAQPAFANYLFTTLLPNLSVVSFDYDSTMVLADLPGLLEEAHQDFGLGHLDGLHTRLLDGHHPLLLFLEMLSPELPEKTYVVAYNKMELLEAYENWLLFKEKQQAHGIKTFCMSAVKRESTHMK